MKESQGHAEPSLGMARQGLGRTGERLATEHLIQAGYTIRERNYRCCYGEIDVIAEHDLDLVFIEVKTRRGATHGLPEEAVNKRKQQKILQVAAHYLSLHADDKEAGERSWRVDVVAIQLSAGGKLEEIRLYQHAFME
ncbi:YraN family protein [Dictyobacter arantiisoli]|uniref:YraN family protein n=1 Tax=Dictyobacter arantiisoli TaxID=2014874 RepID=UPI001F19C681|nr:YraN family protein [Dictyobacter arantiisoli]